MTATASLGRRAKSPLNLVYITTHTCEAINIPLSHMRGELCVPSCVEGNVVWKAATFSILMRAQRPVMFIHPPLHTTLQPPYLLLSHFVCALTADRHSLFLSARSGPKWCGWNCGLEKENFSEWRGRKKTHLWSSLDFVSILWKIQHSGWYDLKALVFSRSGANTPRKSIFIFKC